MYVLYTNAEEPGEVVGQRAQVRWLCGPRRLLDRLVDLNEGVVGAARRVLEVLERLPRRVGGLRVLLQQGRELGDKPVRRREAQRRKGREGVGINRAIKPQVWILVRSKVLAGEVHGVGDESTAARVEYDRCLAVRLRQVAQRRKLENEHRQLVQPRVIVRGEQVQRLVHGAQ